MYFLYGALSNIFFQLIYVLKMPGDGLKLLLLSCRCCRGGKSVLVCIVQLPNIHNSAGIAKLSR